MAWYWIVLICIGWYAIGLYSGIRLYKLEGDIYASQLRNCFFLGVFGVITTFGYLLCLEPKDNKILIKKSK